jgi:hypothetical protein
MFMAIPNLPSLILLNGVIAHETKKYLFDGNIEDIVIEKIETTIY